MTMPLIVLVGPTASGKTSLAVDLARKFGGEIICADSRTVYKGMDIGTAKPTVEEQTAVHHWGIDLVEPDVRFTVADFKEYTDLKIKEIRSRNKIPFLVGGSGLYIDAVIFNYQFSGNINVNQRRRLDAMSLVELQDYCLQNNVKLPENEKNKRYLIRAIELKGISVSKNNEPIPNSIIVGITTNKDEMRERIKTRIEQQLANNVVEESTLLSKRYGWDNEAMTGNIYPIVRLYLEGTITYDELKQRCVALDLKLVKRQNTWFKRNIYIKWLSLVDAEKYLSSELVRDR